MMTLPPENFLMLPRCFRRDNRALFLVTLSAMTPERFWSSYAAILRDLAPRNAALLAKRDALQAKIDAWHLAHPAKPVDLAAYTAMLREIGYLVPEGPAFQVGTTNVDAIGVHGVFAGGCFDALRAL